MGGYGTPGHVRSALLIVDVQNDVATDSTVRTQVIENIVSLLESARSAGAEVVWVQHDDDELRCGSWEWEIVSELVPLEAETRIMKQHRSAFSETGLGDLLRSRQVDHVVLVGSQSAFCVDMAGKHALAEGFHVTLVSDGHFNGTTETADGPVSDATVRALINRTWSTLRQPGQRVNVKPADEIVW